MSEPINRDVDIVGVVMLRKLINDEDLKEQIIDDKDKKSGNNLCDLKKIFDGEPILKREPRDDKRV